MLFWCAIAGFAFGDDDVMITEVDIQERREPLVLLGV
jgi:hypothetical protein